MVALKRVWPLVVLVTFAACTGATTATGPSPTPAPSEASPATGAPHIVPGEQVSIPRNATRVYVTRVVDGDTVVLSGIDDGYRDRATNGHHARLIGIDTPEVFGTVGCFGHQASAFTKQEIARRDVFVTFDVERTDRFGRALVYIWKTDGSFFNAELASRGYAYQLTIPPDVRYADVFGRLVADARRAGRGLWSACP